MTGDSGMTCPASFQSIDRVDPLGFWSGQELDYGKVVNFLDLGADDLSRIGGVSKRSVRLDSHIPEALRVPLEQIADTCAMVAGYFEGDVSRTALWFRTPNPCSAICRRGR